MPTQRRLSRRPLAAALGVLLLAQTAAATAGTPGDPLEKLNRAAYAFNDALDRMLARPAARGYVAVVPEPIRKAVSNFVANLSYPEVVINDALQAKFKDAGSDLMRVLINTTLGIGGLADPATRLGFQSHDEDFGQTLGHWGVPAGPYIVVPLLGPSDLRDGPAKLVNTYANPFTYLQSSRTRYGLALLTQFNNRVELLAADSALRNAFDPYVFVRNAYVARRNYLVHDGNVPDDNFDEPISAAPDAVPPAVATGEAPADAGATDAAAAEPALEGTAPATTDKADSPDKPDKPDQTDKTDP